MSTKWVPFIVRPWPMLDSQDTVMWLQSHWLDLKGKLPFKTVNFKGDV